MMRMGARLAVVAVVAVFASTTASAVLLELGTATGGLGVYFEGSESQENATYVQAQLEAGSDRGMYFEFCHDPIPNAGFSFNNLFSNTPVGQSQFGLDGVAWLQNVAASVPGVSFADYNWDTGLIDWTPAGPNGPGEGAWAINDYFSGGVNNPSSEVRNSLFRGTGLSVEDMGLSVLPNPAGGTIWTLEVSGWLYTDGSMHWYYDTPDTELSDWGLTDRFWFEGTFTYTSLGDDFDLYDFYAGEVTLFAEVVPEPTSMALLGLGLAGLVAVRRRRG